MFLIPDRRYDLKYTEQEIAELREFARAYGFELELEQREPAAVPAELRVEEFSPEQRESA